MRGSGREVEEPAGVEQERDRCGVDAEREHVADDDHVVARGVHAGEAALELRPAREDRR